MQNRSRRRTNHSRAKILHGLRKCLAWEMGGGQLVGCMEPVKTFVVGGEETIDTVFSRKKIDLNFNIKILISSSFSLGFILSALLFFVYPFILRLASFSWRCLNLKLQPFSLNWKGKNHSYPHRQKKVLRFAMFGPIWDQSLCPEKSHLPRPASDYHGGTRADLEVHA